MEHDRLKHWFVAGLLLAISVGSAASASQPGERDQPGPSPPATTQTPTTQPSQATTQPADTGRKSYAPHIHIDWSVPQVEVDARVVLREGPLELLMCSRGTKEHESILATEADPLRLYEAMGLIGLSPGHPVRLDEKTQKFVPPNGTRVALEIRYPKADGQVHVAAHQWMVSAHDQQSIPAPPWVFAGSMQIDGQLGARLEGTLVCVVDFATALIAVGALHSTDNDELWLAADAKAIPPLDTPCTVLIQALQTDPLELSITPEGAFQWKRQIIGPLELDAIIRRRTLHLPTQELVLSAVEGTDPIIARAAAVAIIGSGIQRDRLTLKLPEAPLATQPVPSPSHP